MTGQSSFVLGVIPARFNSSRFPGKPLAVIQEKTMIQRTYENARNCSALDRLIVATDHQGIFQHVIGFGGEAVMTSPDCPTGSDRIAELLNRDPALAKFSIVINIQGDEPCLEKEVLDAVIAALKSNPECMVSTPIAKIESQQEAISPHVVKCAVDCKGRALYFSRSLIPAGKQTCWNPEKNIYRHLGLYAFRTDFLLKYALLDPTPLQIAEDLEQLKILEHGYRIQTVVVKSRSIGVDTPEDIKQLEQFC